MACRWTTLPAPSRTHKTSQNVQHFPVFTTQRWLFWCCRWLLCDYFAKCITYALHPPPKKKKTGHKIRASFFSTSLASQKVCAPINIWRFDLNMRTRMYIGAGFHGSVHHVDCSKWNQRDAVQQVFYCTLVGSTCFGCRRHPRSGAQYVQSRSVGTMCVW